MKLEDFGPEFYAPDLPNVQVISNKTAIQTLF